MDGINSTSAFYRQRNSSTLLFTKQSQFHRKFHINNGAADGDRKAQKFRKTPCLSQALMHYRIVNET